MQTYPQDLMQVMFLLNHILMNKLKTNQTFKDYCIDKYRSYLITNIENNESSNNRDLLQQFRSNTLTNNTKLKFKLFVKSAIESTSQARNDAHLEITQTFGKQPKWKIENQKQYFPKPQAFRQTQLDFSCLTNTFTPKIQYDKWARNDTIQEQRTRAKSMLSDNNRCKTQTMNKSFRVTSRKYQTCRNDHF